MAMVQRVKFGTGCQPRSESKKFPNHSSAFRFWVYFLNFSLPKYCKIHRKIQPNLTQNKGQFSPSTKFLFGKNLHQLPRRSSQLLKQTSPTYGYSFNKNITGWWFQMFFPSFHPYLGKIPIFTNIFQLG